MTSMNNTFIYFQSVLLVYSSVLWVIIRLFLAVLQKVDFDILP